MDNYEIIGTTRKAIEFDFEKKKIRNPEEQDKFVESKYNRALELVELGKRINTSPEKIAEIEEKERLIRSAYNEIKTPFLRMIYNRKIENAKAKTLGKETFALCISMTSVEYPTSVTTSTNDVFNGCELLTTLTIYGNKEMIEYDDVDKLRPWYGIRQYVCYI